MKLYIKEYLTFRTVASYDALSFSVTPDALAAATGTVSVLGELSRTCAPGWAVLSGAVYFITEVSPKDGRTLVKLADPVSAFDRELPFDYDGEETVGEFIAGALAVGWINEDDPAYALPFLSVSYSDTTPFFTPDVDDHGLWRLDDYARRARAEYGVALRFSPEGDALAVSIVKTVAAVAAVVFNDGHSQLDSAAFSRGGPAKVTAVQGDERTNWYLAANGSFSTTVPAERAAGTWTTIHLSDSDVPEEKVAQEFAKHAESHKLSFWSDRQLAAGDRVTFRLNGEVVSGVISAVTLNSGDSRFYYTSGELATTAAEKLRKLL